jgi:hypothetical protein
MRQMDMIEPELPLDGGSFQAPPKRRIVAVVTVYGDRLYVAADDLRGTRFKHQLPLYTRRGVPFADTALGIAAAKRGEATTLARANIATQKE